MLQQRRLCTVELTLTILLAIPVLPSSVFSAGTSRVVDNIDTLILE
jgi:hypothetical protein